MSADAPVNGFKFVQDVLVSPLFDSLNMATPEWLRTLVWVDFRLALLLFVSYPLWLFIGSFGEENDALKRVMIGYWQASSLLMLTVFLNITEQPIGTFTGMFVQIMIPITIWWWKDLVAEIDADNSFMCQAFRLWRWPATVLSVMGTATQFSLQRCNFVSSLLADPICGAWLEPPFNFHRLLIPFASTETLNAIAYAGLITYFGYLAYYVAVPLPRASRSGRKERDCFSSVSVLTSWGWLKPRSDV
ncbi:hypothetical protein NDN08_003444 [Rhodosorus marinus]|uniref:ABC-2 type transporter domain-containing protein n=1 Tax=Rhodosorus marinus TaxID=101924 RepID=A0AAV8UZD3_9RHOD|nr:hypothetical protein NDN08_003444 [Rhodosorus marinus]